MIDTAKLTAAVETLQLYCEQVRHVMVARGYPDARVCVDLDAGGYSFHNEYAIKVYDDLNGDRGNKMFGDVEFEEALAYAEQRTHRNIYTPESIAATIGITPDGRVIADEPDPILCEHCGERPGTEDYHQDAPYPLPPLWLCEPCADRARDRAVERAMEG